METPTDVDTGVIPPHKSGVYIDPFAVDVSFPPLLAPYDSC
jgi:hypothetical protein